MQKGQIMKKIILFLLLITSGLFSDVENQLGDGVIAGEVSYSGNLHSLYLHSYDQEVVKSLTPFIYIKKAPHTVHDNESSKVVGGAEVSFFHHITSASNTLLQVETSYRSLGRGEIKCELKLKNISTDALSFLAGFDIVTTNFPAIVASNQVVVKLASNEQLLLQSDQLSVATNLGSIIQFDGETRFKFKKMVVLESGESFKIGLSIRDRKKRYAAIDDNATTWWQRWLKSGLVPQIKKGWVGYDLLDFLVIQKATLLNGRSPIVIRGNPDAKFSVFGQLQIADMFSKYGFYKETSDILNNLAGKLGDPVYPLRTGEYLPKDLALIDSYYSYLVFDNFVRSGRFAGSLKLISKQFLAWNKLQNSSGQFARNDTAVYSTTTHLLLASGLKFASKLMSLARNRSLAERFLGMSILTTRGLDSIYSDRLSCYLDSKSKQPLTELESLYPFIFGIAINKKFSSSGAVVARNVSQAKRLSHVAALLRYYALQGDSYSFLKEFSKPILLDRSHFLLAAIAAATHSVVWSGSEKWFYEQFKNRFFVLERLSRKLKGMFLYRDIKSKLSQLVENKDVKKDLYKLATLLENLNVKVQKMNFDKYTNHFLKSRVAHLSKEFIVFITRKVVPKFSLSEVSELTPFNNKVTFKLSADYSNTVKTNKQNVKIVKPAILDIIQDIKGNDTYFSFSLNKRLNGNKNMLVDIIISGREKGVNWNKKITRVIKYRYPLTAYLVDNGKFVILKNNLANGDATISLVTSVGVNIIDFPSLLQAGQQVKLAVVFDEGAEAGEYPINIGLKYKGRKFYKTIRVVKKYVLNDGSFVQ